MQRLRHVSRTERLCGSWWWCNTSGAHVAHASFARFFNSANARPARRPSLVAVESSSLTRRAAAWRSYGARKFKELLRSGLP